ncbi:MAG: hypothetical protein IT173_12455 [Acidobacteria bacterium]|nr:hypothetical protein [Acidobacteriota bacterium]
MKRILFAIILAMPIFSFAQTPPIEPGVSLELAKWRAAHYSDARYKLNLTLEKMSPVLKGTIEIRVKLSGPPASAGGQTLKLSEPPASAGGQTLGSGAETRPVGSVPQIILDWRKLKGYEETSTISNVSVNGQAAAAQNHPVAEAATPLLRKEGNQIASLTYVEQNEHLIFSDGVVAGENVIKLDFTSPILTSGSAVTRYVDKEDGAEYIYSLFVPSDASTAFPVFDQPDLKARFSLAVDSPSRWSVVSNSRIDCEGANETYPNEADLFRKREISNLVKKGATKDRIREAERCLEHFPDEQWVKYASFKETKPISTYVFAFAAGPFEAFADQGGNLSGSGGAAKHKGSSQPGTLPTGRVSASGDDGSIYVRKSQAAKFKPHAAEVFRLNREAVKYFEQYFDYKFPFPKYDLVLIPEFPFGGMEHAGATFLRESSIIFPQEPTKNDYISRATLIFHETAHQWFGDTVTMRWFDDLWLKEGFATFMAYKALEKIMPEMNAWKVFYERVKQGAYATDSTKGTTPIYQEIKNLSAAKSAYGNIVYNKAPAFLRQAEFYLAEDKFQTAVRAFLKKHEFGNAGWEGLVGELERASQQDLKEWAQRWVKTPGVPMFYANLSDVKNSKNGFSYGIVQEPPKSTKLIWPMRTKLLTRTHADRIAEEYDSTLAFSLRRQGEFEGATMVCDHCRTFRSDFIFANYGDYGYGIFLLDEKSRDYVLKNIQNEKDPFLRAMMWGALWDSVREGELDPRVFVELVVKVWSPGFSRQPPIAGTPNLQKPARSKGETLDLALADARASALDDESTVALLLTRVGTAMNYYISTPNIALTSVRASASDDLRTRVEDMLIEQMQNAPTLGQRITFYRAFLNIAASENARRLLKTLLTTGGNLSGSDGAPLNKDQKGTLPTGRVSASVPNIPLKTKDKFDIVTRLLILGDPDAPKLLAELEKTETSDDAKRYAYAAKAGIGTVENKAKYWNDFIDNKQISESWVEAAMGPWNSIRQSELTLPYLQKALQELPNHKRSRKIFFINGWLGAFIGGQRSEEALATVNKFLADNPNLDNDLRLKILENVDLIERAVKIRKRFP